MTTPTPYVVTQDDVQALIRVMENAGRAANASWFDVAHRVLQGLNSRGIVSYSIPRVTAEQVIAENQRLELQVEGLLVQLGAKELELADARDALAAANAELSACRVDLFNCRGELSELQ